MSQKLEPPPRAFSVVIMLAVLVCALLACKRKESQGGSSSLGDRVAKVQPEAKKRLEQLAALAPKVKAEPAVAADKPVTVKLDRKTVAITGEQWLTDPNRSPAGDELNFGNTLLSLCKSNTQNAPTSDDDVKYLDECAALKVVAVVRQRSLRRPKIKMKSESFDSGKLEFDALVYDLATAQLIGAYDLLVLSDPELKLPGTGQTEAEWLSLALADLTVNAETEIEKKLGIEL